MRVAAAQTRAVGDLEYRVLPLPAGVALRVMTRVLKMAAPAFGDVSSLREAASAVGTLLSSGLAELDEEVVLYAATEFARVTTVVDGSRETPLGPVFDEHFRGRMVDLFGWLRFAAEVTYGPLGEALKAMRPSAATPAG